MKNTTTAPAQPIGNPASTLAKPRVTHSLLADTQMAGIDGLRAIAVTFVVIYHVFPGVLLGGYIGVDIFFVISGFLITGLLLREKARDGRIRLGHFWLRRARRLLPALAVLVLVCSTAAFAIGGDVLVGLRTQLLGAVTFSYNWLSISNGSSYFDGTTPELFRNLWSLALEEQFYLAWPLLVLLLVALPGRRWSVPTVMVLAAASAIAMGLLFALDGDLTRVYYGTDTHSFGLALGAALAFVVGTWSSAPSDWPRSTRVIVPGVGALSLVALVAAALLLPPEDPLAYQGGLVAVTVLACLAVVGAIIPGAFLGRLLSAPPFRWIGERSYGLYLWHWPVVILLGAALPAAGLGEAWRLVLGGVAVLVTTLAAAFSYRFIEVPIRRDGVRASLSRLAGSWSIGWSPRLIGGLAAGVMVTLSALTVAAIVTDPGVGVAQSRVEAGAALIESLEDKPGRTLPGDAGDAPLSVPGGDQIVAIGDSVMLAAAPELQAMFPGIVIDAAVSRQMRQAPAIAEALVDSGSMRPILVIGLGTNGAISADTLEKVSTIVGSKTHVVLVNVQAPRGWTDRVNSIIAGYAQQERNVELANWHDAIQPQLGRLARDRIHPGGPITGGIYASAILAAIQRLAELPPLLNPNDYGLSPRPT